MQLNSAQRDRALGVIIASAAGDALGAPYEFKPPISESTPVVMNGGGSFSWEPGEWTDDTSMGIPILEALAEGKNLADENTQSDIVAAWWRWSKTASDVGIQTRSVLGAMSSPNTDVSEALHARTGRTAGNGSLMRTGPVALATLGDKAATIANARAISKLTHWDDDAATACVLWCLAIQEAVLNQKLDIRVGLSSLDEEDRSRWLLLIEQAEASEPHDFDRNGWVIHAFQAAWSAIAKVKRAQGVAYEAERLKLGLEYAVRSGNDTDTVAAIAGSLLGAMYGSSAVPSSWRLKLHGWPNVGERQLVQWTHLALNGGKPDAQGWPGVAKLNYDNYDERFEFVKHPSDEGLWLGGVDSLSRLPDSITAVVSLCRVGEKEVPGQVEESLEVLLIDSPDESKNLNLDFVFLDTAATIAELRKAGHEVFLHCVQSQSRTPSVAITYSVSQLGESLGDAKAKVLRALPKAKINETFESHLQQLFG
jgi:ADP-ribosyl-[dinitrogen reductase] hydrolase